MYQLLAAGSRRKFLLFLGVLGIIAAFLLLPAGEPAEAVKKDKRSSKTNRTYEDALPNYDIRRDKGAFEKRAAFRSTLNRSASDIADQREDLVRGEMALKAKVPTLKVEYGRELNSPEIIAPDVSMGRAVLARPTSKKKSQAFTDFLRENKGLIGATEEQVDQLRLFSDYKNPDGNLGFVEYNQEINGIPVFQGVIKAAYSKNGELFRVVNNFAPGLDYDGLSADFGDPSAALVAAARHINYELPAADMQRDAARGDEQKVHFGQGEWSPTAQKVYFPTEPGVAVPAWRVIITQPVRAYMMIVDAASGELLWRKSLTEEQVQAVQFEVYTNPQAMINVADSPAPVGPTVINPNAGTQGTPIFRSNVLRVGNESPFAFNNNGWITDGFNTTDGNNVESGLDLGAPDGIDSGSHASGSPFRVFTSFTWNPAPGMPGPGDEPDVDSSRRGAVIQQFYVMNLFHDEMYRLGFTEQARNHQHNNFGRGGLGNDRISAEAQDFAADNNANFATYPDGQRSKMQMFIFTGPTPKRDGTVDTEIMIHEAAHGVSNRLIGNADGLWENMSRAMGEGWSDFYAHSLLSEPGDPINGTYSLSGWLLYQAFGAVGNQNHYYGIRRFPKAIMSATGGPNNRPFNPLTFADIDQTRMNTDDGAYAQMFGAHISPVADQVHAAGEVWSSALWEVRAKFVQRLGWSVGNRKALQLVTDAMKVSPINPTFLQGRDAIVSVALGSATTSAQLQDASDVWAGFAIRGMGVGASIQSVGTGEGDARVTESFTKPNLLQLPSFTIADPSGDNDGIAEPGETITLTIPLTNLFGVQAASVTADIPGAGSTAYGTIPNAATVTRQFNYTIPANTQCGSLINLTMNVNSTLGPTSVTLPVSVGVKSTTLAQNFDGVGTPTIPAGWTTSVTGGAAAFVTYGVGPDTFPNSAFVADAPLAGSSSLVSPEITVNSAASTVSFRQKYFVESTWDGGVLEISIGGGAYQDIIAAGGSFIENGYNGTLTQNDANPLAGRPAWTGNLGSFVTTTAQLPASAIGQTIRLRWRFGTDSNTGTDVGYAGWWVDSITVRATSSCSFAPPPSGVRSRADFDGDGKTDLSIFRPSTGNWYVVKSNGGIQVITWGVSTDELTPGDFDGDGKTDLAVFRPSEGSAPDFYIMKSNGFLIEHASWGNPGDKPVIGDYDGDGRDDVAVYRPSNNNWYVIKSTGGLNVTNFGQPGDVAVPGKFDSDNITDRAVYRNGQWIVSGSAGGTMTANWGEPGDILVPADYDGDNRDDFAVWRPSTGFWYIRRSTDNTLAVFSWGQTGDVPVPGDYDADGRDDPAVYRNGTWYQVRSSQGLFQGGWGVPGDIPIPRKFLP